MQETETFHLLTRLGYQAIFEPSSPGKFVCFTPEALKANFIRYNGGQEVVFDIEIQESGLQDFRQIFNKNPAELGKEIGEAHRESLAYLRIIARLRELPGMKEKIAYASMFLENERTPHVGIYRAYDGKDYLIAPKDIGSSEFSLSVGRSPEGKNTYTRYFSFNEQLTPELLGAEILKTLESKPAPAAATSTERVAEAAEGRQIVEKAKKTLRERGYSEDLIARLEYVEGTDTKLGYRSRDGQLIKILEIPEENDTSSIILEDSVELHGLKRPVSIFVEPREAVDVLLKEHRAQAEQHIEKNMALNISRKKRLDFNF